VSVGGDGAPISEPCKDSAWKGRCLWTSMKAGMRSPGLYWMGLEWCKVEQPRASDKEEVVVRVEVMVWL
jgi:hypothetical protein